jgi:hypothetical protein
MKKKSILAFIMVSIFALGAVAGASAETFLKEIRAYLDPNINIKKNREIVELADGHGNPVYPISYNGSLYLPIRSVSEIFGQPVQWDNETRTVQLGYEKIMIHNLDSTGIASIEIDGGWHPSYLTPVGKIYSNSFMGVEFFTLPFEGAALDEVYAGFLEALPEGAAMTAEAQDREINGFPAKVFEYVTINYDGSKDYSSIALIQSQSDMYEIHFFVNESKHEQYKHIFAEILDSFKKQTVIER